MCLPETATTFTSAVRERPHNGTIRIGNLFTQTSFLGGVSGVTTGNTDAVPVFIDSTGQLGTVSSSRRFKEDIQDMGEASGDLMRLRPVTYRYKKPMRMDPNRSTTA